MAFELTINGKVIYEAQPKQILFHKSKADETFYGGAAGGGKSKAIIADSVGFAISTPKARVGIFRRTFPELQKSLILELQKTLPQGIYKYNKQDKTCYFSHNGSVIEFNYCEQEDDVFRYQSAEYDRLYFDELTHFTEFQYTYLQSRLRTTKIGLHPQVKSCSNPGNIGHGWVKRRFIEDVPNDTIIQRESNSMPYTTIFIPSKVQDNKYIMERDPFYINRLMSLPEKERRELLEGDWDTASGQAFSELRRDIHVIEPFKLPAYTEMFGAYDHGFNHPYSFGLFAVDGDGQVYLIRHVSSRMKRVDEIAKMIDECCGGINKVSYIVAGHDCWTRMKDGGPTIAEQFLNCTPRIILQQANIDRIQGVSQVRSFLAWKGIAEDEKGETIDGKPKFYFFRNTQPVYEQMVNMIFDDNKPEDVKKLNADAEGRGGDDHYDMVRYGLMSRPRPLPQRQVKPGRNTFAAYLAKVKLERELRGNYVGY